MRPARFLLRSAQAAARKPQANKSKCIWTRSAHPNRSGHLNDVPVGRTRLDYTGQEASGGRFQITPEWSYALNPDLGFAAHPSLAGINRDGRLQIGGSTVRIKWVAPRAEGQETVRGLNFEIGAAYDYGALQDHRIVKAVIGVPIGAGGSLEANAARCNLCFGNGFSLERVCSLQGEFRAQ